MSNTFSLVCEETKQCLWIGQGRGRDMTTFYSGEPKAMKKLGAFLRSTFGKPLRLVEDQDGILDDCTEFELPNETSKK